MNVASTNLVLIVAFLMVTVDECGVNEFGVSKVCVPESCVSHLGSKLVSECALQLQNVL